MTYWMPFANGQGLHDATWRSSFGGTLYQTYGSHGCINLPLAAAATIYNTITAGYPIIIYSRE
ncbi:MAG: L,D-transpeptidase [Lachnospiraceae bacterium]|nr:L,D-transpeptidase [Lachnospiraceae bacterium]